MKLTTVCTTVTSTGEMGISCLRCKRPINTKRHESYVSGFWFPEKPFEPQGEGRSYMYAFCHRCGKKIIDRKTGKPKKEWVVWFEDEIKATLTVERPPRIKAETLGKTSEEFFNMAFGLGHGRRRGEKP